MTETLPQGWLTEGDQRELRRIAEGKWVLELGAWKGRSTVVLAEVAHYVVSVDRHKGIPARDDDSLADYIEAVRPLENVAMVVASFVDFVPLLAAEFDLVFIDGDHDLASVEADIELAVALSPTMIAFHDWDFEAVRQAATSALGEPDSIGGSIASFVRMAI